MKEKASDTKTVNS